MALVGMVALLTAGFLLLARILKLGFLADFLSRTVLVGFLTGVGVQVGIAMLGDMFGVATQSHQTVFQAWEFLRGLPGLDVPTSVLSVLVAASILLGRRVAPRLPVALIAVVGTIAASAAFDFAARGIAVIGPVPGGLPMIALPEASWSEILALMPVAASCFVVIIAQSAATARAFALRYRERVDENADILGLAAANAAAAMSGTFVVNGSPTQTAMADRAGARSQLAQLVFAGVVLVVLLALTSLLQYLPRSVLAAIVFTIAAGMIDLAGLRDIRRESPGEFALALATAAVVVTIGVEQGIVLAMVFSLLRHVRHSYRPHSVVLAPDADGRACRCRRRPGRSRSRVSSSIGSARICSMPTIIASPTRCAAWWRMRRRRSAGSSSTPRRSRISTTPPRARPELFDDLARQKVGVIFARVSPFLRSDMDRHGDHCRDRRGAGVRPRCTKPSPRRAAVRPKQLARRAEVCTPSKCCEQEADGVADVTGPWLVGARHITPVLCVGERHRPSPQCARLDVRRRTAGTPKPLTWRASAISRCAGAGGRPAIAVGNVGDHGADADRAATAPRLHQLFLNTDRKRRPGRRRPPLHAQRQRPQHDLCRSSERPGRVVRLTDNNAVDGFLKRLIAAVAAKS